MNHPPHSHPNQGPVLPPGWMSVLDQTSGRVYYANPTTGQTQWQPPQPTFPPPPPHPQQLTTSNYMAYPQPTTTIITQQTPITATSTSNSNFNNDQTNNNTYISHVSTLQNTSGFIIPAVRAIIQNNLSSSSLLSPQDINDNTHTNNQLEFPELSTGVIADLAHIQLNHREQEQQKQQLKENGNSGDDDDDEEEQKNMKQNMYEPLKPMELPIASKVPHIEPGRVDIRIMSLMNALEKI